MSTEQHTADSAETERLRARIAQLEDELASLQAWANGVVAEAQKRVYWLDRLHLDLDPIMRHMPVDFARDVYRKVRGSRREGSPDHCCGSYVGCRSERHVGRDPRQGRGSVSGGGARLRPARTAG